MQQIAVDNASKAQKRQARYYNASRREVRYNLGDKVWKRNRVISSALQGVAAKLAPKFAGPYTIAAQLRPNVYEVVDQDRRAKGRLVRKIRRKNKPKQAFRKLAKSTMLLLRDIARTLEFQRPRLTRASEVDREKLA